MTLGELIIQKRKEKEMSIYDLSKISTLSTTMLYRLEADKDKRSGKAPVPYIDTVEKLGLAFGMSAEEISALTGVEYKTRPAPTEEEKKKKQKEWSKRYQEKNIGVKVSIPASDYEKLKKAAKMNGISTNRMVVGLIKDELDKERYKEL